MYGSPHKKIREPFAKLCRQIKQINFVPESIVPNIVECFLDIKEGRYYMFTPTETFHNCLRETEKVIVCWLGLPKAWLVFAKETVVFKLFSKTFSMTRSKSFIIALSKLMGR